MCCRYYVDESPELRPIIEEANRAPLTARIREATGKTLKTCGEIRPADPAPAMAAKRDGSPGVFPMLWGFSAPKGLLINARSETASLKPAFAEAWRGHRCVLPAAYYFEWVHMTGPEGKRKTGQKYRIWPKEEQLTFLAGLYRLEEGLPHFTVLTAEPSEEIRFIHDRMPVILPRSSVEGWIRPESDPEAVIRTALREMSFSPAGAGEERQSHFERAEQQSFFDLS